MIIIFYLSFIWLAVEFWFIIKKRANLSFRRAKIALFTWFTVNILSFLMNTKYEDAADQIFPFDSDNLANYDYAEIFIYILLPIFIWYFFKPSNKIFTEIGELNTIKYVEQKTSNFDLAKMYKSIKNFVRIFTIYIILPIGLIALIYYCNEQNKLNKIEERSIIAAKEKENYRIRNFVLYLWKSVKLKTKYEEGTLKFVVDIVFDKFTKSKENYVLNKIVSINIILQDNSGFNIKEITLLISSMKRTLDNYGSCIGYNFQGEFNELSLTEYEKINDWDISFQEDPDIQLIQTVQMVNLIGLTIAEAKFLLFASKLKSAKLINPENILNEGDAFIIDQNPKPYTIIPLDQDIEITISKLNPLARNTSIDSISNGNNSNSNILNIELETNNFDYFTLGSLRETVLSLQGTPTKLSNYGNMETLQYGFNNVILENGRVIGYNNAYYDKLDKLKVKLVPKNRSLNSSSFSIGSTINEVLSVQGSPTKLRKSGSKVTLHYGFNEVILENGIVIDYDNTYYDKTYYHKLKIRL